MVLLNWADLTSSERQLCRKAAEGELVDFRTGQADRDDPARGSHWQADRQIRAQLLYQLLSGRGDLEGARPAALRVEGARVIGGALVLDGLTLNCRVELRKCFLEGGVVLRKLKGSDLDFAGSSLLGFFASRLSLDFDLNLRGCFSENGVVLYGCDIGSDVLCDGARLSNREGPALIARNLSVGGDVLLRDGFAAIGHSDLAAIRLDRAHIGGDLDCTGAQVTNDDGPALFARNLSVNDNVLLASGFAATAHGEQSAIFLKAGHIGGDLDCSSAHLANDAGPALHSTDVTVDGNVLLGYGFNASGRSNAPTIFLGGRIGGDLNCAGAKLSNDAGSALWVDALSVTGSMRLQAGFTAIGRGDPTLYLSGSVGGDLECPGAQLSNDAGPALFAKSLTVDGVAFLRDGFSATGHGEIGAIAFFGGQIGGDLDCSSATLTNDAGPALFAQNLTVNGNLVFRERFAASGLGDKGVVSLNDSSINTVTCGDTRITNIGVGSALYGINLSVSGDMLLRWGFTAISHSAEATVNLYSGHVGGDLDCRAANLTNDAGPALQGTDITVGGSVLLGRGLTAAGHADIGTVVLSGDRVRGALDLVGAQLTNPRGPGLVVLDTAVGPLRLDPAFATSGQSAVVLSGLTYRGVPAGEVDWWINLLSKHTPEYFPQPWQQLATVHRAAGHERDARRILVAQQDDRRRRLLRPSRDARVRTRASLWLYRTYLGLQKLVVGYGYQTWRALIALLFIVIMAAGLGLLAGHFYMGGGQYVARHTEGTDTPNAPCSTVEQIGLGVDLGLPILQTNMRDRCDLDSSTLPGQWITAASWAVQVLSWSAATLVVAGYTGVVRRS